MKKHIITKHKDHVCKECKETFNSFMELLKHIAKHHNVQSDKATGIKVQDEVFDQNGEEDKEVNKYKPMSDELLWYKRSF